MIYPFIYFFCIYKPSIVAQNMVLTPCIVVFLIFNTRKITSPLFLIKKKNLISLLGIPGCLTITAPTELCMVGGISCSVDVWLYLLGGLGQQDALSHANCTCRPWATVAAQVQCGEGGRALGDTLLPGTQHWRGPSCLLLVEHSWSEDTCSWHSLKERASGQWGALDWCSCYCLTA